MDHWEGLKDADWMWSGSEQLTVSVRAPEETMRTIERGYEHPAYVALERLAAVAGQPISFSVVGSSEKFRIGNAEIETYPLNHFSGYRNDRSPVETVGYCVRTRNGASAAYFSDHMPDDDTAELESRILHKSRLAVFDAHYPTIAEQNFGHGSLEYAAMIARKHPSVMILAGHHGATLSDDEIRAAHQRFSSDTPLFRLAVEGDAYEWCGEEEGWQSASTEEPVRLVR
jgi:hypothetical protein